MSVIFRTTSIGKALDDSLAELYAESQLDGNQCVAALEAFDKVGAGCLIPLCAHSSSCMLQHISERLASLPESVEFSIEVLHPRARNSCV
jgi:hypothetical protein